MLKRFLPVPVSSTVESEQIRLLYHQGATIQLLGIVTAIVSVVMFWNVADHTVLGLWFSVHLIITLLRLAAAFKFNQREFNKLHPSKRWGQGYVFGAFVSGLVWGSLSLVYDPSWPAPYQVMLIVIYTGITAGAFNTHSSYFAAFPAFYLPPVMCLTYTLLGQKEEGFAELTSLFMIYTVLMYVSALKYHNRLAHSLEIRFDNERLAEQLAGTNRQLAQLADLDDLTGMDNRRSMDRHLSKEWSRAYRTSKPLSLLIVDVDFFKQYNDNYGHDAGDECLTRVAKVLRDHAKRSSDMAARFGGEEFAVILPETGKDDASRIAEAIRTDLEKLKIPHASSKISEFVTISIGTATIIPKEAEYSDQLRLAADKALYQAKNLGRNRVIQANSCSASPTEKRTIVSSL
jgi:diguanylate cyclase (GGDEF)-like protein